MPVFRFPAVAAAALLCGLAPLFAWAQAVSVRPLPQQPLVERMRDGQQLNFDLLFENPGDKPLELVGLELTRFDRDGRFIGQRRLDRNGDSTTMGIATVPNRALPAHGMLWLFLGGLLYTVGAVVFATDRPRLWPGKFSAHDLWHMFVLGGSACHFLVMLWFVAPAP